MDIRNRELQDGIYLDRCNLSSQPDFSEIQATALSLSENSIHVLLEQFLPQGIRILDYSYNYLHDDGLPDWWPNTLEELYLTNNSISNHNDELLWPDTLKRLCLSKNPLQMMPSDLPNSLEMLSVDKTQITRVSRLPMNLKIFSAEGACLRFLPRILPDTLEKLFLQRNFLASQLPRHWGTHLQILNLEKNKLRVFPKNLPDSLRILRLSYNDISKIPEELPENLTFLSISHNKVRTVALTKRKTPIQCVYISNNQLIVKLKQEQVKQKVQWASSILEEDNWATGEYGLSAKRIQKHYKLFRLKKILRTWRKVALMKEELLATAMQPSRAGHYENVSPEWNLWGC
jgi:Leucine-rich repeat (LRR) protein